MLFFVFCDITNDIPRIAEQYDLDDDGERVYHNFIKYFGLEVGYRFLIDKNGYEDVWYDEKLKNV